MYHLELAKQNNIIGWSIAAINQEHWSFMDNLLIIQPIDATTKKDVAINDIHNYNNVLRCLLRLTNNPTNEELEEYPDRYFLIGRPVMGETCPTYKVFYYETVRHMDKFDYSTPEEAMTAAVQELEWTEKGYFKNDGIPSDYYSPYKS
jgi:hypothetical protein